MNSLDALCDYVRETALLESTCELLQWDERTYLPPKSGEYRAQQIACLSGMIHQRRTDPQLGEWLRELDGIAASHAAHSDEATTVRQLQRDYQKQARIPRSLIEELSGTSVRAQQAWVEARANRDVARLKPYLERIVELKRQQAQAVGFDDCLYDALLDDFEPEEKTANVARIFALLREALVPFIQEIIGSGRRPSPERLRGNYPAAAQERMGMLVAERIGFELDRGRLDVTAHPFCSGLGPHDCRITTRYDESYFPAAFYSILHEAGHGIYEQGLPGQQYGLPPGKAVSMGIHESQSRLWENLVGRSREFWQYFLPIAARHFPDSLGDARLDDVYFAVNDVRPSLIRVEADEATYNLHILIRFELEQELIEDQLRVADLPEAWNSRYQQYLGIAPAHDGEGVLQDIHWSAALIGYFPTYALGNLYASQFFARAREDLSDLDDQIGRGEFRPLREWLQKQIHVHGQKFSPAELVQKVTGRPLSHEPLMTHLREKMGSLY